MDLNGLWNQLLLNASTVCIRPSSSQGIQVIAPYATSSDTNSSCESNTTNQGENVDETDQIDEETTEDGSDEKKRAQRVRYSREEYKCKQCPYTCTTERAFLKHSRNCEPRNEDCSYLLSCPVCGKDRKDEESLSIHMTKHKQDRHFCCDLCKFKSLQLKKLIQHRRMHTGEKPHLCPFCSYRSSRRDNLRSHVRRVHKKSDLPCDTFTPRSMVLSARKVN